MKLKRLDRDIWWSHNKVKFPEYYQMHVDFEDFHGLVGFLQLIDGEFHYWNFPKAGKSAVIGKGMKWLQLIPDGKKRVITAMYLPDNKMSVCYVDVIEEITFDTDGVAVFTDKYLDVIFTPKGDMGVDDRNELDDALASGDVSKAQYESALAECDAIVAELCADFTGITKSIEWFDRILGYVSGKVSNLN